MTDEDKEAIEYLKRWHPVDVDIGRRLRRVLALAERAEKAESERDGLLDELNILRRISDDEMRKCGFSQSVPVEYALGWLGARLRESRAATGQNGIDWHAVEGAGAEYLTSTADAPAALASLRMLREFYRQLTGDTK